MNQQKKLHIALFPWLAFGHMIPYLELAKLIAKRGHHVSFISTPKNMKRLPKIPSNIHLVSLTLPCVDNLPSDAEATNDLPTHKVPYLKKAYDALQAPLLQFLQASTPDWIIYDFLPYWLPPITAELGISGAFFSIFNGWTCIFYGSSSSAMINGDDSRTELEDFTTPPKWVPFPSNVAYHPYEAKKALNHFEMNDSGFSDLFRLGSVMAGSDVIAVRSCFELEGDYLRLIEKLHGKPTLPVGLLPPQDVNGGEDDETWRTINKWLNGQNKASVVYIAFGSEVEVSPHELTELTLGLELSGLPFFWTLRTKNNSFTLPNGFEERVKGRGIVWRSWVPQLKILSHESVGGILTHCGCSSLVEALYLGRTLIMLPIAIDQGLNARFYGEKKVGVEIARDKEDGSFTKQSVAETLKLVMVEEKGKEYRDGAKEMSKLFADKQLHEDYLDRFVEFLQYHRVARNLN